MPTPSNVGEVTLLWQMSNGRRAELSELVLTGTTNIDATVLAAQERHVAETVTPDATGTALPFSISGLPSGALSAGHLSHSFPATSLQALADDVALRGPAQTTWTRNVFPDY
jgi:hypothetical protein